MLKLFTLFILWEVKHQVYSFWPHFKTPPTTFFWLNLQVRGISFFHRTERTSAVFSAFASFQNDYQNEHRTNIAEQERTENEQRKQHIYGVWTALFGCSARIVIHPCTCAHTCATLPCEAVCAARSGSLSAERWWANIGSQCTSFLLDTKADDKKHTDKSRCDFCWSHSVIPQAC